MPENKRVKISSVVKNQLPDFIKADFPLAGEFLAQYYTALEGQGSTLDVLQNIDKYIKVDELTDLIDSTSLSTNVGIADNTITVNSTTGFPDSFGLLEIDSEIITYTGVTTNTFTGCSRGFSGITSYRNPTTQDELIFTNSGISTHSSGSVVNNLSVVFLKEFLKKVKKQINPGFEERTLSSDVNQRLFTKQVKDFYSSKGTDQSFEILFRALYGEDVEVIKPRDFLFIPSDSNYKVAKQIVVESIEGDPEKLINRNLFQDNISGFSKATGAVSGVEKIVRNDKVYFIRIEQLYPFPVKTLGLELKRFKKNAKFFWCQEEPQNMGAWNSARNYIEWTLDYIGVKDKKITYIGRKPAASPATGYIKRHVDQQKQIVEKVLS